MTKRSLAETRVLDMAGSPENRLALENIWRARLRSADERVKAAQSRLRQVEEQRRHELLGSVDGDFAYRQAVRGETAALVYYSRVLRITSDLVLRGVVPTEPNWKG